MTITEDPEMRETERTTGGSWAATYEVARFAAAINLVMLLAIPTAGMVFAVDHLAEVTLVLFGLSFVAWAGAAMILVPLWLISRIHRPGQAPPDDPLHDIWLDESGGL